MSGGRRKSGTGAPGRRAALRAGVALAVAAGTGTLLLRFRSRTWPERTPRRLVYVVPPRHPTGSGTP